MMRDTMIKWLSGNTTREQWSFDRVFTLPVDCHWFMCSDPIEKIVRSVTKGVKDIKIKDVFSPEKSKESFIDGAKYELLFTRFIVGPFMKPNLFTYELAFDRFIGCNNLRYEADDVRNAGAEITVNMVRDEHESAPIITPEPNTLYWDKYNRKHCYIVGSAWDDGALFFAEEFIDGAITGNYFATERVNLVEGDKRITVEAIINEELKNDTGTTSIAAIIAERIFSEVISHDK